MRVDNAQRIKVIFEEYPELKSLKNIKRLIWYYWVKYEGIKEVMNFDTFNTLTTPETITRYRRKVLADMKEKDIESTARAMEYREEFIR